MKKISLKKFTSLRSRIMISVLATLALMIIILASTMRLDLLAVNSLGDSYKSNTDLNLFSQQLAETEKAMENYVIYHTFESIDSYYSGRSKVEDFASQLQESPSKNELLQKEYVVKQLSKSFVIYSNKAITARRANSTEELEVFYSKTINCYNHLLSELLSLNKLFLQENAENYKQNNERIILTTKMSIVLFMLISLLIFMLLYFMITNITKPLAEISEVANRVSKRDFDVPLFQHNTDDEIGNICRAFNRMIISIREYIDTIWEKARTEAELKEKEIEMQALYTDAQLRALQNQINPHFLFNTLNTGSQLAMMEGADKTCYFIEQVADFFRYNIQQQEKNATVDEELGLVDNFVYIMKVRFGERLEFIKEIPNGPFKEQIPVMTLQPLVENCIKHGLKNTKGKVILKIENEEKHLIISVSDNGSGMPAEIRESVFNAVKNDSTQLPSELINKNLDPVSVDGEKHTGTGLVNVFLRLKMNFHNQDVFDITTGENGVGTKFIIRIPKHV